MTSEYLDKLLDVDDEPTHKVLSDEEYFKLGNVPETKRRKEYIQSYRKERYKQMLFEVRPEEAAWFRDEAAKRGITNVQLFRVMMTAFREEVKS